MSQRLNYSHAGYTHTETHKTRDNKTVYSMLIVQAMVGRPLEVPSGTHRGWQTLTPEQRATYDCVTGMEHTSGYNEPQTRVYCLHKNELAYPAFVMWYTM